MDISDLFDRIAEAFRQYQAKMTEQTQASTNPNRALGLDLKPKLRKRKRKWLQRRELNNISQNESDCGAFGRAAESL